MIHDTLCPGMSRKTKAEIHYIVCQEWVQLDHADFDQGSRSEALDVIKQDEVGGLPWSRTSLFFPNSVMYCAMLINC